MEWTRPWLRVLKTAGRAHTVEDARRAIADVQASGVRRWSLDLISGLPGLDPASWRRSLEETVAAAGRRINLSFTCTLSCCSSRTVIRSLVCLLHLVA